MTLKKIKVKMVKHDMFPEDEAPYQIVALENATKVEPVGHREAFGINDCLTEKEADALCKTRNVTVSITPA
jgi:hypothetical protein